MKKSTFIKLGVVAALVMLPRRSSKKSGCGTGCGCSKTDDKSNKDATSNDSKTGCNCKNCICPLCRIGKCPLCAIGKCFCCKKSGKQSQQQNDKATDKKSEK